MMFNHKQSGSVMMSLPCASIRGTLRSENPCWMEQGICDTSTVSCYFKMLLDLVQAFTYRMQLWTWQATYSFLLGLLNRDSLFSGNCWTCLTRGILLSLMRWPGDFCIMNKYMFIRLVVCIYFTDLFWNKEFQFLKSPIENCPISLNGQAFRGRTEDLRVSTSIIRKGI